jgi:RNA polymerase sigma factor (sigma-70 family)
MKLFTAAKLQEDREDTIDQPVEDDEALVAKARDGDQAAFYELVRRHRVKACGIARSLIQDHHLAEDIVQEALIRAFLQLGTLVDGSRFLPWFHRIVRTQAWMKLRRGGLYGREMTFTKLTAQKVDAEPGHWEDVDRILFHLRQRSELRGRLNEDPSEEVVRKELLDTISGLMHCLSRKERAIFEAHFFRELSPKEIAECFQTTPAYVYTSISRTKVKLQNERLLVNIKGYVNHRRTAGLPVKKILDASIIHFK